MADKPTAAGADAPAASDTGRIQLSGPLADHWIDLDRGRMTIGDFEDLAAVQSGNNNPVEDFPKMLNVLTHVITGTSLPGATVREALRGLTIDQFMLVVQGFAGAGDIPNAS